MAAIRKKAAIGEEEGRQLQFHDLPDEILIRILSMLPTKDAVWTCLLVLRRSGQQQLWKYLTGLQFHENNFTRYSDSFTNFVDRVMDLHDHSVPLVSLSLRFYKETHHIKTWITKAVEYNVEELTLSVYTMAKTPYRLIFGCQSLVKLDLQWITINVPSSMICLPRLKYLRIREVDLEGDDESIEKLLSSPMLEKLIIYKCCWGIKSITVCSPKLQVLKITDYYTKSSKICIIGDNLKYFSYKGGLVNEYRICASSSTQLGKVHIYVNEEVCTHADRNCYEILQGLYGTQNLTLSDYFLELLRKSSELLDTIPIFEDLTRLDIRVYKAAICIDSLALMKIYERCPRLECLNIGKLSCTVRSPQLSLIPLCFQTHLKKIFVHYYVPGDGDEVDAAVDMLLNVALVLEELVIYCKMDKEKSFHKRGRTIQELQDRLNRRPRVSKDCIISLRVYK